jgi:hypothetical protein
METLDQGSHHPLVKYLETDMSRPAIEVHRTPATFVAVGHSTNELASQLLIYLFGTSTDKCYFFSLVSDFFLTDLTLNIAKPV